MPEYARIEWQDEIIICILPITRATSKIRVKRNHKQLATRQVNLCEYDLIEWQISYFNERRELIELGKMLKLGYENDIWNKEELGSLETYINSIEKTFAEEFEIRREPLGENFQNFEIIYEKYPILRKELQGKCSVEIALRHKQRAIGYQPMLFLFIPLKNLLIPPIGRPAMVNEEVKWVVSKWIVEEVIKSFAIASRQHQQDMKELIKEVLGAEILGF